MKLESLTKEEKNNIHILLDSLVKLNSSVTSIHSTFPQAESYCLKQYERIDNLMIKVNKIIDTLLERHTVENTLSFNNVNLLDTYTNRVNEIIKEFTIEFTNIADNVVIACKFYSDLGDHTLQ